MPVTLRNASDQHMEPEETLAAQVDAGDVKDFGGILCIATVPGEIGDFYNGWAWPNGSATYRAPKEAGGGVTFSQGDDVFFDISADTSLAIGGDGKIGVAVQDAADDDDFVDFVHQL